MPVLYFVVTVSRSSRQKHNQTKGDPIVQLNLTLKHSDVYVNFSIVCDDLFWHVRGKWP